MKHLLLAALALALLGAAVAAPTFARLGPVWIFTQSAGGGGGGGGSGCGTAPAQASAAGFTSCALFSNWTESTGADWVPFPFAGPVTTLSNWLDCADTAPNTIAWHWDTVNTGTQTCAGSISVITDSVCGCQVMSDVLQPSTVFPNGTATGSQQSYMGTQRGIFAGTTGVPTNVTLPIGNYWEVTYRVSTVTFDPINGEEANEPFDWNTGNGFDVAVNNETYGDNGFYSADGQGYSFANNFPSFNACNGTQPPGYESVTSGGSFGHGWCGNSNPGTTYAVTNYYKYGVLTTTDGGLTSIKNTYSCVYINDILQTCGLGTAAGSYAERSYLLLQQIAYTSSTSGSFPISKVGMYVQKIRVFSCSGWATGQCNGSTLFNSNGLIYIH